MLCSTACTAEPRIQSSTRLTRYKSMASKAIWTTGHHLTKSSVQGKSLCLSHLKLKRKLMILESQVTDSMKLRFLGRINNKFQVYNNNNNKISQSSRIRSLSSQDLNQIPTTSTRGFLVFRISKLIPRLSLLDPSLPKRQLLVQILDLIWVLCKIFHLSTY